MGDTRERTPWSDAVSAQIRAERAAKQWTRLEMATASGIPVSTYRRLETAERVADASQLARLCGALGMPLSEFFRRVEQRDPEAAPS